MSDISKKNAIFNISLTITQTLIASAFSLYLTSILVKRLGVEYYGFVPLLGSVTLYLGLFTTVLTSSVGRFTSLSYYKNDIDTANKYYSSGFWGLFVLGILAFITISITSLFIDVMFDIPQGGVKQVRSYFILTSLGAIVSAVASPLAVPAYIKHSFFLTDIIRIIVKIIQVLVILLMMRYLSLSLIGWTNFVISMVSAILSYCVSRRLVPQLKISLLSTQLKKVKDMATMGVTVLVGQIGGLLYFHSDVIIINIFLGASSGGRYGLVIQAMILIRILSGMILKLFDPIIVEYVSLDKLDAIVAWLPRFIKLITLANGFLIFLLSGFSVPILRLWVGEDFTDLAKLFALVGISNILLYSPGLVYNTMKAMNKINLASLVTLSAGIFNIILSIILVKYTSFGMYGAALATMVSVFIKNVLFNTIYLSRILKFNPFIIWKSILVGVIPCITLASMAHYLCFRLQLSTLPELLGYGFISGLIYCLVAFYLFINQKDRKLLLEIAKLDKILRPGLYRLILR